MKTFENVKSEVDGILTDAKIKEIKDEIEKKTKAQTDLEAEMAKDPQDESKINTCKEDISTADKNTKELEDNLINDCMNKIDENLEEIKLASYSAKVKELRGTRKIQDMEKEVSELEGEVSVIELKIAEKDKQIEELRAGIVTGAG